MEPNHLPQVIAHIQGSDELSGTLTPVIRLSNATIKNYKGIKSLSMEFSTDPDRSVYPIIGLNESGKTTILEALTFVNTTRQDLSALEIVGLRNQEPHQLIPIGERTSFTGDISVALTFKLEDDDVQAIVTDFKKTSGYEVVHIPKEITLTRRLRFDNAEKKEDRSFYGTVSAYRKASSRQAKPNDDILWP